MTVAENDVMKTEERKKGGKKESRIYNGPNVALCKVGIQLTRNALINLFAQKNQLRFNKSCTICDN
jgi:hypothetical protein